MVMFRFLSFLAFMWFSWQLQIQGIVTGAAAAASSETADQKILSSIKTKGNPHGWIYQQDDITAGSGVISPLNYPQARASSDSYVCNLNRTGNCRSDCQGNLTHVGIVYSEFYFGINAATECKSRCYIDFTKLKKQDATLGVNATFIQQSDKGPVSGELSAICRVKNQADTTVLLFYFEQTLDTDKGTNLILNITAPVTIDTFPDKVNNCTFKVYVSKNFSFCWTAGLKI